MVKYISPLLRWTKASSERSYNHRIIESQNHRMVWVGKDLKYHLVPTPSAMGRNIFHLIRLLRAPSNPPLNTAREGVSTTSLGNLLQCLSTLMVKNFFLISNPNLPSFSLKPLPLVLPLHALVKCPFQLSCRLPSGTGRLL